VTAPPSQLDLLALVAIAGMPVPVEVAVRALDSDASTVMATGKHLVEEGRLTESAAGYSLVNGAGVEVSPAATAYLSGRAADAFAGTGAGGDGVGRLLLAAGRSAQAWRVLADEALTRGRHRSDQEQLNLLELALLALDQAKTDGGELEGRIRLQLGRLYRASGRTAESAASLEAAIRRLVGEELIDALAFAAAVADDLQHPQEAERWVALAELAAAGQGSWAKLGSILTFHGRELSRLGFASEAEATLAKGNSLLEQHGSEVQRFYGRLNQAWVDFDQGQMKRAEVAFARLREDAEEREGESSKADKEAYWARALFGVGHVDDALSAVGRALELADSANALAPRFIAHLAEAEGGLLFDRWETALAAADNALAISLGQMPSWENVCRYLRARAMAGAGRKEEARAEVELAKASTPSGSDGLRWRLRIEELQLELSDTWDQRRAEDLSDLLLQSRWLGAAADLMTARARREKDSDLAAEAAALALQIGNPVQAAKAVHAGGLWGDPVAAPVLVALRGVANHLPEDWRPDLLSDPAVIKGLESTTEVAEEDVALLRSRIEQAMESAGLAGEMILSPAQRRAAGLVRRRPVRGRRTLRVVAAIIGIAAVGLISGAVVLSLARDPVIVQQAPNETVPAELTLEETPIPAPDIGLSGNAPFRGDAARTGVVSGGFRTPLGRYWTLAPGGSFTTSAVTYGRYLYVATDENQVHVIEQTGGRINHSISTDARVTSQLAVGQPPGGETDAILVFATADGFVYGYSALREGPRSWRYETGPVTAAPLLAGNSVYVASTDGYLYALDLGGRLQWQYPAAGDEAAGRFESTPAVSDGMIYLTDREGLLYALGADNGVPICPSPIRLTGEVGTNPAIADGVVYVQTESAGLHALGLGACGMSAVEGYQSLYPTNSSGRNGPAVIGKTFLYVESRLLQAIDLNADAWADAAGRFPAPWNPFQGDDILTTPPVVADGVVYVGSQGGKVFAVDLDTGEGLWGDGFFVGAPVRGEPVVVRGAVFVTTAAGELWAIAGE
jgi:outer membrane protein assembly factor BamB